MLKSRIWIIIALLFGLLAALLANNYLSSVKQAQAGDTPTVTQVVAKTKVGEGTRLTSDLLGTVQVPVELAHPSAATDISAVVGLFATTDLWPGEIILSGRLANQKTSNELPFKIPEGLRAETISVGAVTGVGGHLKPGHYVDVLSAWPPGGDSETDEWKSVTLLQNVLVLAVGTHIQKEDSAMVVDNVTLAVSPEDAQKIFLLEAVGKLKLIARPAGDAAVKGIDGVDFKRLMTMYP